MDWPIAIKYDYIGEPWMNVPQPFWAVLIATLGVVLSLAVLFHNGSADIGTAVLAIASNLVSGALGAFAGHAAASKGKDETPTL